MDITHLTLVIPAGADTPPFFWLTGFIIFPMTFLGVYFWWVLKEVSKEDRRRILKGDDSHDERS